MQNPFQSHDQGKLISPFLNELCTVMLTDRSSGREAFQLVGDEMRPDCATGAGALNLLVEVMALIRDNRALPGCRTTLTRPLESRGPR